LNTILDVRVGFNPLQECVLRIVNITTTEGTPLIHVKNIIGRENKHKLSLKLLEDLKNGNVIVLTLASDGGATGCFRPRWVLLADSALSTIIGQGTRTVTLTIIKLKES
jgi:hypothetical protein